jgi:hypothetical protein
MRGSRRRVIGERQGCRRGTGTVLRPATSKAQKSKCDTEAAKLEPHPGTEPKSSIERAPLDDLKSAIFASHHESVRERTLCPR